MRLIFYLIALSVFTVPTMAKEFFDPYGAVRAGMPASIAEPLIERHIGEVRERRYYDYSDSLIKSPVSSEGPIMILDADGGRFVFCHGKLIAAKAKLSPNMFRSLMFTKDFSSENGAAVASPDVRVERSRLIFSTEDPELQLTLVFDWKTDSISLWMQYPRPLEGMHFVGSSCSPK